MSNKLRILLLLLLGTCHNLAAQILECGTSGIDSLTMVSMPYYGNGEFLEDVLSITNSSPSNPNSRFSPSYSNNQVTFNLPVKVWVFHDDNGSNGALTDDEVHELLNRVNEFHANNNTNIRFYLKCAITHINNSSNNLITNKQDFDNTLDSRDEINTMDWFFVEDINWVNDDGISVGGAAYYPWQSRQFKYAIETEGSISNWLVGATVHEVGHNLGLAHTFDGRKGGQFYNGDVTQDTKQELVSRSAEVVVTKYFLGIRIGEERYTVCEVNGDAICDTEANPRDLSRPTNLSGCDYVGEINPTTGARQQERDLLG